MNVSLHVLSDDLRIYVDTSFADLFVILVIKEF